MGNFWLQTTILRRVPKFELPGTPAREFSKTWNLVSIEDTYRATGKKMLKEIRLKNFEKSIVQKNHFCLQTTILRRVPKFELPGTPPREYSKRLNLVSTEEVYSATSRNLFKEIRREIFVKSLVDYKGLMLFIGVGVPKFELLDNPAREFLKTWNLVSIEDTYRATGKKFFKRNSSGKFWEKYRRKRVIFAYKRPYWDRYQSSSSRVPLLGSFQRDKTWWVQRA